MPRDRAGTFTPRLVRKGQRRLDGLDAMIISLYAGGIEKCGISSTTWPPRSARELSVGTISRTRRRGLLRLSRVWQHVSAGGVLFPVVYHGRDSGRWSAPVHRVASRSAHIAVGAGHGRLSSTWLKYLGPGPRKEPPSRAARVRPCRHNRGVSDMLIVEGAPPAPERSAGECDGPGGPA